MIVAQYSVHAIAGPEPDYGIHFPNIRSPEGWQKDDARAPGMLLNDASPTSPDGEDSLQPAAGESSISWQILVSLMPMDALLRL